MATVQMAGKPIFEHRHFVWLAHWAGANLDADMVAKLCDDLARTNPKFDRGRWMSAANGRPNGRDAARCNVVPC